MVETNARIEWDNWATMYVCIGDLKVISFHINPRRNTGGARRPKTQAVYIAVHHPQENRHQIGGSMPLAEALEYMKRARFDQEAIDRFLRHMVDEGWSDLYEVQETQGQTLFETP